MGRAAGEVSAIRPLAVVETPAAPTVFRGAMDDQERQERRKRLMTSARRWFLEHEVDEDITALAEVGDPLGLRYVRYRQEVARLARAHGVQDRGSGPRLLPPTGSPEERPRE